MIYLVTRNQQLFNPEEYTIITLTKSLDIIKSWDIVQFDSETSGRDAHICDILCVQFANRKADTQIVVDILTIDLLEYKEILETKLLVGHNLKFDIQFLYNQWRLLV